MRRMAQAVALLLLLSIQQGVLAGEAGLDKGAVLASGASGSVVGRWMCRMYYMGQEMRAGEVRFTSDGRAFMGQAFNYRLAPGNRLILFNQSVNAEYRYGFEGDTLLLHYSDGSSFRCARLADAEVPSGSGAAGGGRVPAGTGSNWQLSGLLCSYSGSSYGGSYGHTNRLYFDGRGHWTMRSETYSSGEAGLYGGQAQGPSGTYVVQGDRIYYTTADGERGVGMVKMRQDSGRITEIVVDGTFYATGLCD